MKKLLARQYSKINQRKEKKWIENPIEIQQKLLRSLIQKAKNTRFGKEHNFEQITDYESFKKYVPIREYEELKPYIDEVVNGATNILWAGKPSYFAKTSGTTSGAKYIPISRESMPFHIYAARNALLNYINNRNADFVNGKMIFLQGSPQLDDTNGVATGRLSGIVAHFVPPYLQRNRMPSWQTNCIEDWETKLDTIVEETQHENMTLISGIPPWLLMYFERLQNRTGKKIGNLFPNLQLIVTGGVNYEPYREKMNEFLGRKIDIIQTYPASEGFIAYQDQLDSDALLLLLNQGIFYEFIPVESYGKSNPPRLDISQVELNKDYALILSSNAGLWAYSIGDTVRFVSEKPYRIVVSGRIKHYTSAFGEHVIAHEVETALAETLEKHKALISEFHVAPQVNPKEGLPYHEWLIEFEQLPENLEDFAKTLDLEMQQQNPYYLDLIQGKVLKPLVISPIPKNAFNDYMKSQGKLGGQNKTPRLANDRKLADKVLSIS